MASTVNINITNLPQIKAAFKKAPILMGAELDIAIKKAIFTVQAQSMRNTPVLTGRLRASTRSQFSHLRGEIGTHTNYDIYVHEGTRYMRARPYLRDAVHETNSEFNRFFTEAVDNVLKVIGKSV